MREGWLLLVPESGQLSSLATQNSATGTVHSSLHILVTVQLALPADTQG
jgi:hypothetical protein